MLNSHSDLGFQTRIKSHRFTSAESSVGLAGPLTVIDYSHGSIREKDRTDSPSRNGENLFGDWHEKSICDIRYFKFLCTHYDCPLSVCNLFQKSFLFKNVKYITEVCIYTYIRNEHFNRFDEQSNSLGLQDFNAKYEKVSCCLIVTSVLFLCSMPSVINLLSNHIHVAYRSIMAAS